MTVNFKGLSFNVIDDLRNDLILYYAYDKDYIFNLPDKEVFFLIEKEREKEEALLHGTGNSNGISLYYPCDQCNRNMVDKGSIDGMDDFYILECPECKHVQRVHYTIVDNY